nr:hypothetical protein [Caballeronia sp. NK8]
MRALTEGARALAYIAAAHADFAHHDEDAASRARHQAINEYLVPIVKGWSTEMAIDVTSLGVQGAWRDGLHRGDGRGPVLSRRADPVDL